MRRTALPGPVLLFFGARSLPPHFHQTSTLSGRGRFDTVGVLLKVIGILLFYVRHGADVLRLDAVTYLWNEPGTRCAHLEQTHEIIKLLRDVLSILAPYVALVTETNVPNEENVAYFGNGRDEAHMVCNFALPPLVLHTFYTGDARALSKWANSMASPSDTATFFNFLDSHDGIGLLGAQNILSLEDIKRICQKAADHGGFISYKTSEDGMEVPYEINIAWYSALNRKQDGESLAIQIKVSGLQGHRCGSSGSPGHLSAQSLRHTQRPCIRRGDA